MKLFSMADFSSCLTDSSKVTLLSGLEDMVKVPREGFFTLKRPVVRTHPGRMVYTFSPGCKLIGVADPKMVGQKIFPKSEDGVNIVYWFPCLM